MEQLLSPKKLAAMLEIAEQTIYNRHSTGGDLPLAVKIGQLLRFRSTDVKTWLDQKQRIATRQSLVQTAIPRRRGRPNKAEQIRTRSKGY